MKKSNNIALLINLVAITSMNLYGSEKLSGNSLAFGNLTSPAIKAATPAAQAVTTLQAGAAPIVPAKSAASETQAPVTPPAVAVSQENPPAPEAQAWTLFDFRTPTFYKAASYVGLSDTQKFAELTRDGKIEKNLNAGEVDDAMQPFLAHLKERLVTKKYKLTNRNGFRNSDPREQTSQEKILRSLIEAKRINNNIKSKTHINYVIPQPYAITYNATLAEALEIITHEDANIHQPELEKNRNEKIDAAQAQIAAAQAQITAAHDEYNLGMELLCAFAATTASNKRYMHKHAQETTPYDLQDKRHYQNNDTYTSLLRTRKKDVKVGQEGKSEK